MEPVQELGGEGGTSIQVINYYLLIYIIYIMRHSFLYTRSVTLLLHYAAQFLNTNFVLPCTCTVCFYASPV